MSYRKDIIKETASIHKVIKYYNNLRRDTTNRNDYLLVIPNEIWKIIQEYLVYIPRIKEYCDVYDAPRKDYRRKWFCSQILNRVGDLYTVRFIGWSAQWNERVLLSSGRIQKRYTRTVDWRKGLKPGYRVDILINKNNSYRSWYPGIVLYRNGDYITVIIKKTRHFTSLSNRDILLRRSNFNIYIFENIKIYDEMITRSGFHCSLSYIKNYSLTEQDLDDL